MTTALDRARALLDTPAPAVVPGQLAAPLGPRIGSVCSGYRGLDAAVEAVFGGSTAWVSDIDPGANRILAHHWPDVPNHGDLTTVDWSAVEPVDIFCGGYPCQPFSAAGLRKGTADARHIWPDIARALRVLRPQLAIFENVANHLRIGFDQVLRDLAALGFDAEWCTVRASEVGAPHQRNRLFIFATAADAPGLGYHRGVPARGRGSGPADHRDAAADASRGGCPGDGELPAGRDALRRGVRADAPRCGAASAADAERHGRQGQRSDAGADQERSTSAAVGCGPAGSGITAADAARFGHGHPRAAGIGGVPAAAVTGGAAPVPDTTRLGRGEGRPEPARQQGRPGAPSSGAPDWGRFAPAITRWEHATGRRAPWATDDRNRLSPQFVEWLMGLPAGHVTNVPELTRNQQLHALGNGVVPQQAEAALRLLAARAGIPTTA